MPSKVASRSVASEIGRSDWEGVRLHVVSGKGGTGKTTVAAALALALAGEGRRTLLVEVEGRQGIAHLFDSPPLPYAERKIAAGAGGGDVFALAVDPEAAMLEYLEMFYRLGRAGSALRRLGAIDFATTIAPGLRDLLLTGKVYEAVRRSTSPSSRRRGGAGGSSSDATSAGYDAVVLDAPPTGRITRFLGVSAEVATLTKFGPIKAQARSMVALLRSAQTVIHLVTLLEEMPIQETVDAAAELTRAGLSVGSVVVNGVHPPWLPAGRLADARRGRLDGAEVARGLDAAGIDPGGAKRASLVETLLAEAATHAEQVALEKARRRTLSRLERPTYELPQLPEGIDLGGLYELAGQLRRQGAA